MKKRIIFEAPEDLIIFKDSQSEIECYAITRKVLEEKMKIVEKFGGKEIDVPDEYKIKVHPIRFFKHKDQYTDIYKPTLDEIVDFPINKIEWIWIQVI
ncbi:MAG TPA: hypothetical protein PLJ52_05100 [Tenuifilaceae bacterium]|nr:hypothetical protein [Tenuifilaceae bacterium]